MAIDKILNDLKCFTNIAICAKAYILLLKLHRFHRCKKLYEKLLERCKKVLRQNNVIELVFDQLENTQYSYIISIKNHRLRLFPIR